MLNKNKKKRVQKQLVEEYITGTVILFGVNIKSIDDKL
jgi:hypothetical protein